MINTVIINGRFLGKQATGVDRVAFEVLHALDVLLQAGDAAVDGLAFLLAVPPGLGTVSPFKRIPVQEVGSLQGHAWEQWSLTRFAGKRLLVNLCNSGPVGRHFQLSVIHDVATVRVPQSYGRAFRAWYGFMIPAQYRRSASIMTVSQFSRSELAALYGDRADVGVLPEGVDHIVRLQSDPGVLARHGLGARPYVLAVSSLAYHKNFALIMKAVATLDHTDFDVVIAGGQNPAVFAVGGQPLPATLKHVGYVSDAELKALYERAACFVFPSLYEGYGLPPTEAMACGCPVLATRAASVPEVCGDAAIYFDPNDAADLAGKLKSLMADAGLRKQLADRGRRKSEEMSWRNSAKALLGEIRRISALIH